MDLGEGSNEPDGYALGVIEPGARKLHASDPTLTFKMVHQLTESEWSQLDEAILAVNRLDSPFHYKLLERNFLQLRDIHQFVSITISLGKDFASGDRQLRVESVMTATVNWLSSMRMFLDHEETDLKRRFGKASAEFDAFNDVTSAAYDDEVGYRFAYQFRNYVQHCGLPLSRIQVGPPATPNPHIKQVAKLQLDRDALLDRFDGWKQVQHDLEAMPPTFELLPLLAGAMTGLRAVNRACMEIDMDLALASTPLLATALDRLRGVDGEPVLFRYTHNEKGGLNFSPRPLHAPSVRKLQGVVEGRATRESLWKVNDDVPPSLPMDPVAVREKFHRDNRGVQIISAWLQEGGATPGFFEVVNEFLREDKGIEPVLTGLINASTLLAHMAAGSLGTTAEALVAGILDQYSQVDEPAFDGTLPSTPDVH